MPSIHYVLYIPSAIQASTHMPTHCTALWVGGSTVPPSPPTAGSVGKRQKVCPTREESCSHVRWEGGSVANSLRLRSWIYTSAPKVKTHVLSTGAMYCSTLHLASLPVAYHHIKHIKLCGGHQQTELLSSGKLAVACGNENRYSCNIYVYQIQLSLREHQIPCTVTHTYEHVCACEGCGGQGFKTLIIPYLGYSTQSGCSICGI